MTDEQKTLVEWLRGHSKIMARDKGKFVRFIDVATCNEAADLIDALEAEIARLRETLGRIARLEGVGGPDAELQCADMASAALAQETQG